MASFDKREAILLRLLDILRGVDGFVTVWRDRGPLQPIDAETKAPNLPAGILLDGSEVIQVRTAGKALGGRPPPATTFVLRPQIWIVLMPKDNLTNEGVGEELSAFRVKVYTAVTRDGTLAALLGNNGEIEYRGSTTDMQTGSSLEGQMQMDFDFTYVLNPNEL
jgi:hypothetical protein